MKRVATLGILLALTACQQQQQEPDVSVPPSPVTNHALPMLVAGERAMPWIADRFNADRFNGLPTTPNCGQF